MKRYDTLPVQLELPFEPPSDHCPICNPSGDAEKDMFRSMCNRHWREHNVAFDEAAFHADMMEVLEEGRKHAEAMRDHVSGIYIPGNYTTV